MADIRRTGVIDNFERAVYEVTVLPPWFVMDGHFSPEIGGGPGAGGMSPVSIFSVTSSAYLDAPVFYGPRVEVWAIQGEGPDLTEDMHMGLLEIPFRTTLRKGYAIGSSVFIGGSGTFLDRWDDGVVTTLASVGGAQPAGSIWLLRIGAGAAGDKVQCWFSYDNGANWTMLIEVTDTTYRAFFYAWLRMGSDDGAGPSWGPIGGGQLNRSQEYRWFPGLYDYPLGRTKETTPAGG